MDRDPMEALALDARFACEGGWCFDDLLDDLAQDAGRRPAALLHQCRDDVLFAVIGQPERTSALWPAASEHGAGFSRLSVVTV
jgi:hypothetical protein